MVDYNIDDTKLKQDLIELNHSIVSILVEVGQINFANIIQSTSYDKLFYWKSGSTEYLAINSYREIKARGNKRFESIKFQINEIIDNIKMLNYTSDNSIRPKLFGGFSFHEESSWKKFEPGYFFLPKFLLINKKNKMYLIFSCHSKNISAVTVNSQIKSFLQNIKQVSNQNERKPVKIIKTENGISYAEWQEVVSISKELIQEKIFDKVVLSRNVDIKFNNRPNLSSIIRYFENFYPSCYHFLFKRKSNTVLFGASPELLLSKNNSKITTVALAGTRSRGSTKQEDIDLEAELFENPKERSEHKIVVDEILSILEQFSSKIEYDKNPKILKLNNVQHLQTNIKCTCNSKIDLFKLLSQLHPTPALGGRPRKAALDFILKNEKTNRGWYASPIGWIDTENNATFIVAIRSALLVDDTLKVFTGAGIVKQSKAKEEWQETNYKMESILNALELEDEY